MDLCRRAGAGIHIHVAEDAADQRDAEALFGIRVIHRLAEAGALTNDALLAHCIHLNKAELAIVRESGAAVAHNPTSNMNNSVGHAPVGLLGDRVALGTDGLGADMFAESRAAYFRARDADVFTAIGWPLARLAEGARLVGRIFGQPRLGGIEVGAPADLAVLEYPAPTPLTGNNLAGHWMFGLDAGHVRDVVVAGELVVADGRSTRADQDKLIAEGAASAERLWRRLQEIDPHEFHPAGGE